MQELMHIILSEERENAPLAGGSRFRERVMPERIGIMSSIHCG